MRGIQPYRASVTSFSSTTATSIPQHQQAGFEYDSGEYILSIASSSQHHDASAAASNTCVASALSNKSIVIYDSTSGQVQQRIEKAHDGPISQVSFFPCEYNNGSEGGNTLQNSNHPPLLMSASQDGTVKVFDLRTNSSSSAITTKLALPNEQALCVSLGYGGTLAAVGTSKARVSFLDLRYTSGTNPTGALMGSYVDAHTDEVTQVKFQSVSNASKTVLATASEDGLLSLYDPTQPSEEAALLSTLNIGAPLRHIGFFGPNYEGICALTGNETMSVWHWDSAQKVSDVGGMGLRGLLSDAVGKSGLSVGESSVEYLVGCTWASANCEQATPQSPSDSKALHLLAGNSEGDGYLFRMDADQITPLVHLKGGHRGCIRDFCWVDNGSGGQRLVTGGEDARLCEWDLSGTSSTPSLSSNHGVGSGKVKQIKRDDVSRKKGKKKFDSPY